MVICFPPYRTIEHFSEGTEEFCLQDSNPCEKALTIEASQAQCPEVAMDSVVEVVALNREQAALEHRLMNTAGPAVTVEWALASTRP